MTFERDMSAAAMMGELPDVTAENTWHGFGDPDLWSWFPPTDEELRLALRSAALDAEADRLRPFPGRNGRRRDHLVTPAEMSLALKPHGNWPLFSAAELGGPFEFFRGGDAD